MIPNVTPPSVTGSDARALIVAGMVTALALKAGRPVRLSEVDLVSASV